MPKRRREDDKKLSSGRELGQDSPHSRKGAAHAELAVCRSCACAVCSVCFEMCHAGCASKQLGTGNYADPADCECCMSGHCIGAANHESDDIRLRCGVSPMHFGPTVVEKHERLVTALLQAFFCSSHSSGLRSYMMSSCDSRGLVSLSALVALQRMLLPELEMPGPREATNVLVRSPFFRLERIGSTECSVMPRHPQAAVVARRAAWLLLRSYDLGSIVRGDSALPRQLGCIDPWVLQCCSPQLLPTSVELGSLGGDRPGHGAHGTESMDDLAFRIAKEIQARSTELDQTAGDPADLFMALVEQLEAVARSDPSSDARPGAGAPMVQSQAKEGSADEAVPQSSSADSKGTAGSWAQGSMSASLRWVAGVPFVYGDAAAPVRCLYLLPSFAVGARDARLDRPAQFIALESKPARAQSASESYGSGALSGSVLATNSSSAPVTSGGEGPTQASSGSGTGGDGLDDDLFGDDDGYGDGADSRSRQDGADGAAESFPTSSSSSSTSSSSGVTESVGTAPTGPKASTPKLVHTFDGFDLLIKELGAYAAQARALRPASSDVGPTAAPCFAIGLSAETPLPANQSREQRRPNSADDYQQGTVLHFSWVYRSPHGAPSNGQVELHRAVVDLRAVLTDRGYYQDEAQGVATVVARDASGTVSYSGSAASADSASATGADGVAGSSSVSVRDTEFGVSSTGQDMRWSAKLSKTSKVAKLLEEDRGAASALNLAYRRLRGLAELLANPDVLAVVPNCRWVLNQLALEGGVYCSCWVLDADLVHEVALQQDESTEENGAAPGMVHLHRAVRALLYAGIHSDGSHPSNLVDMVRGALIPSPAPGEAPDRQALLRCLASSCMQLMVFDRSKVVQTGSDYYPCSTPPWYCLCALCGGSGHFGQDCPQLASGTAAAGVSGVAASGTNAHPAVDQAPVAADQGEDEDNLLEGDILADLM